LFKNHRDGLVTVAIAAVLGLVLVYFGVSSGSLHELEVTGPPLDIRSDIQREQDEASRINREILP
jgi:hypothetical protein